MFEALWILAPEGGSGCLFKEQKRAVSLYIEEKKKKKNPYDSREKRVELSFSTLSHKL